MPPPMLFISCISLFLLLYSSDLRVGEPWLHATECVVVWEVLGSKALIDFGVNYGVDMNDIITYAKNLHMMLTISPEKNLCLLLL
jgi:hypothetical protein